MKHILLILLLACSTIFMATEYQQIPFESTSTMPQSETFLPCAAIDGVTSAADVIGTNTTQPPTGPRRVSPDGGYADPGYEYDDPVGDALLPLALLATAYTIYTLTRKKRAAN